MKIYSDVLGNNVSAWEIMQNYRRNHGADETLPEWIERQSRELWGDEHNPDDDWNDLADDLKDSALAVLEAAVLEISTYGDPDDSLMDWLSNGDYHGSETIESIAAEWDDRDD